jgi:predicted NBD/HSP70 family sugar kinase
MTAPSTSRDLRRANRTAVLRELLFHGTTSRAALATATGLSTATVGVVVGELIDERLVRDAGAEESAGGRPRTLVSIAEDRALAVGVDLGERGLRVESFDLGWRQRSATFVELQPGSIAPADLVDRVGEAVQQVVADAHLPGAALLGVGVSVPGIVERTARAEVHAAGLGWDGLPLGALLAPTLPGPVIVDNGAKAMGQAEFWFGAARGAADAVVALLGIGVGAAIITEGRLYRGARSSAGEWGHTPIVVDGDLCRCGSRGCLEAYVGESAILRRWAASAATGTLSGVSDTDRIEALFRLAEVDPAAGAVADDVARYLGAGLATLVNLFNPDRIVLAGSVGLRLTPAMLRRVAAAAERFALRQPFESTQIVQGSLGDDAVALGAATLIVDARLASGFTLGLESEPTAAALVGAR